MRNLYSKFRKKLNDKQKGQISKFIFIATNKPIVRKDNIDYKKKFPDQEKGGLIISADFEMAWAWRYTKTGSNHILKGQIERENMPNIIAMLEEYNIPITFATVGHLFLKSCNSGEHDWMKRIPYFDDHWKFTKGDWYDFDPCSSYQNAPEWYAPDLIQDIIDSSVKHEIGSHTFSHIDFSYKNCPIEVAEDEIIACIQAAQAIGINIESMVFPGGTWGNIEVLKNHKFKIYRKRCDFELSYPFRDKYGLLVSTSSASLEYNLNYGWTQHYYTERLKEYLNKAIATNTIAHLWFHPSLNPIILQNILPPFLRYASQLREKGDLWIGTMKAIADHIDNNHLL